MSGFTRIPKQGPALGDHGIILGYRPREGFTRLPAFGLAPSDLEEGGQLLAESA